MSLQDSKEIREAAEFEHNVTKSVFVIRAQGSDSMCGNPFGACCIGTSVKCDSNINNLPEELKYAMPVEEYLSMISEIDEVLQATLVPAFPCMFGHFCLPFSPICFILHYKEKRRKGIQAVLDKYNAALFDRGYHWEPATSASVAMGFAFLKTNRATNRIAVVKNAQIDGSDVVSAAAVTTLDQCGADSDGDYEMIGAAQSPIEHEA